MASSTSARAPAGSPIRARSCALVSAIAAGKSDVNWAALAERRLGAGTHAASFVYLHIGAGLGMGLYIGDQLVRGAHGN